MNSVVIDFIKNKRLDRITTIDDILRLLSDVKDFVNSNPNGSQMVDYEIHLLIMDHLVKVFDNDDTIFRKFIDALNGTPCVYIWEYYCIHCDNSKQFLDNCLKYYLSLKTSEARKYLIESIIDVVLKRPEVYYDVIMSQDFSPELFIERKIIDNTNSDFEDDEENLEIPIEGNENIKFNKYSILFLVSLFQSVFRANDKERVFELCEVISNFIVNKQFFIERGNNKLHISKSYEILFNALLMSIHLSNINIDHDENISNFFKGIISNLLNGGHNSLVDDFIFAIFVIPYYNKSYQIPNAIFNANNSVDYEAIHTSMINSILCSYLYNEQLFESIFLSLGHYKIGNSKENSKIIDNDNNSENNNVNENNESKTNHIFDEDCFIDEKNPKVIKNNIICLKNIFINTLIKCALTNDFELKSKVNSIMCQLFIHINYSCNVCISSSLQNLTTNLDDIFLGAIAERFTLILEERGVYSGNIFSQSQLKPGSCIKSISEFQ